MKNKGASTPSITWVDGQPKSTHFNDVYYSLEDGLAESRYVFLEGNQLANRWRLLNESDTFTIAETGFGTGLNFLAAWQLWQQLSADIPASCCLHFISVEKFPLNACDLLRAHQNWPELTELSQKLVRAYPPQPWYGIQTIDFGVAGDSGSAPVKLTLIFEDIKHAFKHMAIRSDLSANMASQNPMLGESRPRVDAWFLDGFAPSKNPEMWGDGLFNTLKNHRARHTSFSTFTSAGAVRRALQEAGFHCEKKPGFGRKREMLTGHAAELDGQSRPSSLADEIETANTPEWEQRLEQELEPEKQTQNTGTSTAKDTTRTKTKSATKAATKSPTWILKPGHSTTHTPRKSVLVIGGGLAGCHTAHALAKRGYRVHVLEKNTIASGSSSNIQGAVYTRLSHSNEALSYFNRSAQIFSDAFYSNTGLYEIAGEQCGLMHLATSPHAQKRLVTFYNTLQAQRHFKYLDAHAASQIAGIALHHPALFSRNSGWLSPVSVCRELLKHKNIEVTENHEVHQLHYEHGQWFAEDRSNHRNSHAPLCVIANAACATKIEQTRTLPLQTIRGQVNHALSEHGLSRLRTVICGDGYLCPGTIFNDQVIHSIGATFNLKEQSTRLRESDTDANLASLVDISREFDTNSINLHKTFPGKVGFRSTTPDYLPIVGPVPRIASMQQRFARLSKKANADIDALGDYYPGLYCNVGFGSRGLAYTPLAASLISALLTGDYLPISQSLYPFVHPARFVIRALIKNKPLQKS